MRPPPPPPAPPPGADATTGGSAAAPAALKDDELVDLLKKRLDAKTRRDYASSDAIRLQLEQFGIKINDARAQGLVGTWTASDGRR